MADIYVGMLHPLATPSHILILLGLSLLVGQRTPLDLRTPLLVFAPVSAVALLLTTTGFIASVYQPILICLALVIGTLVALEKSLPAWACRVLFATAGLVIGLDSGVETGSTGTILSMLLGTWICLMILWPNIALYLSQGATKQWLRIGMRVIGSWIIAISLLVLAFSLRK